MASPLAEMALTLAQAIDEEEPLFVLILHSPASDRTIMHQSRQLDNAGVMHLLTTIARGLLPPAEEPGVPPTPTVAEESFNGSEQAADGV